MAPLNAAERGGDSASQLATTHVQGQARAASERQARARHPSSGDMRHMHGRGSRRGTAVRPHAPRLRGNEWRISAPCFLQLSSLPGNRQTHELALGPGRGERRSGAICLVTGPALRRSPLFVVRMLLRNVLASCLQFVVPQRTAALMARSWSSIGRNIQYMLHL